MTELPRGPHAILCLQCTRRYRSFARYLEHSSIHDIGRTQLEAASVTGTPGEGFWWRLPDQWLLVSQALTVKGEPSTTATHEQEYVEGEGFHVLRSQDVNGRLAVCDLDAATPVTWAYPVRRFIGPTGGMMGGPTAACEGCHVLIERRDLTRLFKRIARRIPMAWATREPIKRMIVELLDNVTGPAVKIGT